MTGTCDADLLGERWVARRHLSRVFPSPQHEVKAEQAADDFDAVNRPEPATTEPADLDW